eukprot:12249145-Ditylum_brightwellii.AAC.1
MVKHDLREALHKSVRTASNMTSMELEEYFKQIELLDNLKQIGSETIVVNDDSDGKKLSKKKKGKAETSTKKGGKQNAHKRKSHFPGQPKHGKFFVCCANSLAVLRKLIAPKT